MKEVEIKTIEVEKIKEVICDCCGNSCKAEMGFEFLTLETTWGFMSNKDLEKWEAQVCESCVDKYLGFIKFKKTQIA